MTSHAETASASGWSWGATWTGGDDTNEDEEDAEEYHGYVTGRDCLLLLVDCSAGMFESSGEDESAFELSIRCCKTVLLNKIISSDKDLVGVVFFGTDKHKNPSDFKHVFILQDLDLPDAPRIKQLDEFLEDADLANSFQTEYGHNDAFSLSDVFWTCSNMFANMSLRAAHQRILLFTNNDNPHHSSLSLQRQAKTKAKDLADAGIDLELMHIQPVGGRHFDLSLFYQDLLFTSDDDGPPPDPSGKFEELLTRVRSKEYPRRTLQRIPFSLAPGLEIGIGVYCMVREAKKPSFVRLDRRSNEELKTQTKYLCDDTGNELMKGDMKYYQMFGGEKVIFAKEEVDQMKKFDQPGLVLVGFKPRSRLKRHHYVKPANFIYPDETVIQGSSKLFTALLRQCLKREVIAICRYIPRTNASPIFVAMVPQDEEYDDQGVQISPPGFNLIFIPFASDFHSLTIAETAKANNEQIDAAKDVIKKLTFPFDSESFENPVLQKHFRTLEAIALEQPNAEEVNDLTIPDADRIEKRAGTVLEKFKQLVYPTGYEVEKGTKQKARFLANGASKRAKISEGDDVNVEEYAKNKILNSLTMPILANCLKSVGRKVADKKQDLIDPINEHLVASDGSPSHGISELSIKDEKQMNKPDYNIADKPISSNATSKQKGLDLSNCKLSTIEAIDISIKFLKINNNEMCDEAAGRLAATICKKSLSLTELNISHNKLTLSGITEIINALSKNDTTGVLDISYNCIAPNNTDDLAVALSACTQLKILNASHNSLTFDCILKIAQKLRDHVNLQTLILSNNIKSFISEAEVLVDIIFSNNNSLTHLDISGRNIRPRFTGDYLSPPSGCENSCRFLLHNLYLSEFVSMTDLSFENTSVVTPPYFIKATEECPIDAEIISYHVDHNGGTFYNQDHDFAIVVPPGAVLQSDGTVEIQATAGYKYFKKYQFPDEYLPVSSIFWFSAHYTFKIPVYLIMGHYASSTSLNDLHFMQACVRDLTISEDGKLVMKEVIDGVYIDKKIGYCLFMTDHFCSVCLQKNNTKLPDRFSALYYTYDDGDIFTADLCFVPSNPDCRKEIEKQYQGKKLDFSISFEFCKGESLYIPTDFSRVEGWYVTLAGITQISYDDFEYWRYEDLEVFEKNQEYPPRFRTKCIKKSVHSNLLSTFIVQKKRGNEVISTIGKFPIIKMMKDSEVQRNGTIQQHTKHTSEFCSNPENRTFPKISKLINVDWKHIGLLLEVKKSVLDCIESNHTRVQDKALHMLFKWKESNPHACYCHLHSALREQDLPEAAEYIKDYVHKSGS